VIKGFMFTVTEMLKIACGSRPNIFFYELVDLSESHYCPIQGGFAPLPFSLVEGAAQRKLYPRTPANASVFCCSVYALEGYPLKAGHLYDFKDLAPHGVFVSEAEAKHQWGIKPFQRDPETSDRKSEPPVSCHPLHDNRNYAGQSTLYSASWVTLGGCDAFVT
jgi:hypothetical protein